MTETLTMVGGPLDGRIVTVNATTATVNVPVMFYRGRGRIWTAEEYYAEIKYVYPERPEPPQSCPTCGHIDYGDDDDDYRGKPTVILPLDLEQFCAIGRYTRSDNWAYSAPTPEEMTG